MTKKSDVFNCKRTEIKSLLGRTVHPTKVTFHNDGTITVKRSFFYRTEAGAELMAEKIAKELSIRVIESYDDWKPWPKISYFVVKFELNSSI